MVGGRPCDGLHQLKTSLLAANRSSELSELLLLPESTSGGRWPPWAFCRGWDENIRKDWDINPLTSRWWSPRGSIPRCYQSRRQYGSTWVWSPPCRPSHSRWWVRGWHLMTHHHSPHSWSCWTPESGRRSIHCRSSSGGLSPQSLWRTSWQQWTCPGRPPAAPG